MTNKEFFNFEKDDKKLIVPDFVDGSQLADLINSETPEYLRGFACGANWMIQEVKRINGNRK